jgi:hypothetical protein
MRAGKPEPTPESIVESIKLVIKPTLDRYKYVYLICHSLGGNVIRDYLTRMDLSEADPNACPRSTSELQRYRGLFLLATPVFGSLLTPFANALALASQTGNVAIQSELEVLNNEYYLDSVNRRWAHRQQCIETAHVAPVSIWAAFEERQVGVWPLKFLIVEKAGATYLLNDRTQIKGFDKNQVQIAKPADPKDRVYDWVKRGLLSSTELHQNGTDSASQK